jgi:hypothetical protein
MNARKEIIDQVSNAGVFSQRRRRYGRSEAGARVAIAWSYAAAIALVALKQCCGPDILRRNPSARTHQNSSALKTNAAGSKKLTNIKGPHGFHEYPVLPSFSFLIVHLDQGAFLR